MKMRSLVLASAVGLVSAFASAHADDGKLRLNFSDAPSVALEQDTPDLTLDEMLSVSPRTEGLKMSLTETSGGETGQPRIGVGFGDQVLGLNYELFTSFAGSGNNRFGISGLDSQGLGRGLSLNGNLSLDDASQDQGSFWQVGGKLGYGGFSMGADFARESSLNDRAEYRDYRLGVSYGGTDWRVGMQYMRSLQQRQENLLGVADALEFGGVWNLNSSINLVGGVQFWDQDELSTTDTANRDALIFVGTRIQF